MTEKEDSKKTEKDYSQVENKSDLYFDSIPDMKDANPTPVELIKKSNGYDLSSPTSSKRDIIISVSVILVILAIGGSIATRIDIDSLKNNLKITSKDNNVNQSTSNNVENPISKYEIPVKSALENLGIWMDIPNDWKAASYLNDEDIKTVTFSPKSGRSFATITVQKFNSAFTESESDYLEYYKKYGTDYISQNKSTDLVYELISSDQIELNGKKAFKIVDRSKSNVSPNSVWYRTYAYYIYDNDKTNFMVRSSMDDPVSEDDHRYVKQIESILNSFKVN